jgi:hypothetical protein
MPSGGRQIGAAAAPQARWGWLGARGGPGNWEVNRPFTVRSPAERQPGRGSAFARTSDVDVDHSHQLWSADQSFGRNYQAARPTTPHLTGSNPQGAGYMPNHTPRDWRKQAELCRRLAEGTPDRMFARKLLDQAEVCEAEAEQAAPRG